MSKELDILKIEKHIYMLQKEIQFLNAKEIEYKLSDSNWILNAKTAARLIRYCQQKRTRLQKSLEYNERLLKELNSK